MPEGGENNTMQELQGPYNFFWEILFRQTIHEQFASIFHLVRIALVLKHQKCFTPLPQQGLSVMSLLTEKEKRGKYVLCKTHYFILKQQFYFSVNDSYFSSKKKRCFLKNKAFINRQLTYTLVQYVTFLGKFQNRNHFYLLAEVFGDGGRQ